MIPRVRRLAVLLALLLVGCAGRQDVASSFEFVDEPVIGRLAEPFGALEHLAVGLPLPTATLPTENGPLDLNARPMAQPLVVAVLDRTVPPELTAAAKQAVVLVLAGPKVGPPLRRLAKDEAEVRDMLALDETPAVLLISDRGLIAGAYDPTDLKPFVRDLKRLPDTDPVTLANSLRMPGEKVKPSERFMAGMTMGDTSAYTAPPVPLSGSPYIPSEMQFHERVRVPMGRRAVVEAYRKHGRHDPRWDDVIESDYEAWAADAERRGEPLTAELAAESGDPFVHFTRGSQLSAAEEYDEAWPEFRTAWELIQETDLSPTTRFWFAGSAYTMALYAKQDPEDEPMQQLGEEVLREYADLASAAAPIEELVEAWQWYGYHRGQLPDRLDLILSEPDRDAARWLRHMARGMRLREQARDMGYPGSLPVSARRKQAELIELAHHHLFSAWALQPSYPWAAAALMELQGGPNGLEREGETARRWHDRAARAMIDVNNLQSTFLTHLRYPLDERWAEYGRECAATERYDTQVPMTYLMALRWREDREPKVWRQPEVWREVQKLCEGMLTAATSAEERNRYRSIYAAAAWRCGRPEIARRQFEILGDDVSAEWIKAYFDADLEKVRAEVMANEE